jgi:type III restriction enzyme
VPDPLAGKTALNQIAARLSLRAPQRAALAQLADILDQISLERGTDLAAATEIVSALAPSFEAFEREFPSLCFALATGVGKTRLMGAFIAWLSLTDRSRNFFVLAPNTTIYEKLITDFTPGTVKYVFTGIPEFTHEPPLIITGENYVNGAGLRRTGSLFDADVIVNIFNVDKINSDKGRIRRLQEYLGTSYFEYLAGLPDLVLLMDEAHRYRAAAGMSAITELKPILGLELTATPKTVGATPRAFRNVVYEYGLAEAMADGLVKQPAVATRNDFRPEDHSEAELERIKLEDAVTHHDFVAVELARFSRVTGEQLVHPFILVVATDTAHAGRLKAFSRATTSRPAASAAGSSRSIPRPAASKATRPPPSLCALSMMQPWTS